MFCKNCGKAIHDTAVFCEHCGAKTVSEDADPAVEKAKKRNRNVAIALIVFVILFGVSRCAAAISGDSDTPYSYDPVSGSFIEKEDGVYKEGTYKVGTDIPAGEYFIKCKGRSCNFTVSSDSSRKYSSEIAFEYFHTFMFVTVIDGQYLQVDDGEFVPVAIANVPKADKDGNYGEGMYRVGIDIPAGEYKVTCTVGNGAYVEVNSDSFGTYRSEISSEYVETFYYITVEEGQYLTVEDGQFAFVE